MFRAITVVLFAGAIVTQLTATVYAKPIERSQPENRFNTLSGESLRGLESRNLSKDSPVPEASPISETSSISARDNNNSEPSIQIPAITVFGTKVEISRGRSSGDSNSRASGFVGVRNIEVSTGASSVDTEQVVKVQYQLLSSPDK
jgi:hypothetical protein